VRDLSMLEDPQHWEIHPDLGNPQVSSGACWNVGMTCNGPDAMGVYTDCAPSDLEALQPPERYTSYFIEVLREELGKEVVMLAIGGVPSGGVGALEFHDWRDGPYPMGDVLPEAWEDGLTAAHKQWELGIGPGCTAEIAEGTYIQAVPPARVREVCESLDTTDRRRCCIESICDSDYASAITCLGELIDNAQ
jgi:hypothetical protein